MKQHFEAGRRQIGPRGRRCVAMLIASSKKHHAGSQATSLPTAGTFVKGNWGQRAPPWDQGHDAPESCSVKAAGAFLQVFCDPKPLLFLIRSGQNGIKYTAAQVKSAGGERTGFVSLSAFKNWKSANRGSLKTRRASVKPVPCPCCLGCLLSDGCSWDSSPC